MTSSNQPPLPLAVTTSVRNHRELEPSARAFAEELGVPYMSRANRNMVQVFRDVDVERLLVVAENRLILRDRGGAEYSFHPNMVLVRAMNLEQGWRDIFVEATGLGPGDSILDCTIGFAAEATLASLTVGPEGRVRGLESVPELAIVTREGVKSFPLKGKNLRAALQRIEVISADHTDYLTAADADSFDIVYFDPFFEDRLPGSESSVSPLFHFGNASPLGLNAVIEAKRVARRRVVIKHPKLEPLPEEIQSLVTEDVTSRKSRVVYAVIEV